MIDALRTLKMWQVATLIVAFMAAGGGTFGGYVLLRGGDRSALKEDQQIIPVQRGDLVNDVSISGTLIYPNRDALTFGTPGSVGQVLVEEGQQVQEGQRLVLLDDETVAGLERAVAQAKVTLRDAKEALADMVAAPPALDLAQAEAAVADARASHSNAVEALAGLTEPDPKALAQAEVAAANAGVELRDAREGLARAVEPPLAEDVALSQAAVTDAQTALNKARETLDRLLKPTGEDVARAESAVSDAEVAFRSAGDALEELLNPTARRIAEAGAAVTTAKLALEGATERLATLKGVPDADVLAKAQSDLSSAVDSLSDARIDRQLTTRSWDDRLAAATDTADAAREGYREVFLKWLGVDLSAEEAASEPGALLAEWGADLNELFSPGSRFAELTQLFSPGVSPDDPATRWDESTVTTWANFFPGTIVSTCADETLPDEQVCVRGEFDAAWKTLAAATDDLETVRLEADKAVGRAVAVVTNAEGAMTSAEDRLAELQAPADALEVESAEREAELARLALQAAEEDQARLSQEPDAIDVAALKARVALASSDLESARADLASLLSGPDEIDVEEKTNLVALTEARFESATVDLAELIDGVDEVDVEAKRMRVALAEADLADAETALAEMRAGADPLELDAAEKRVDVTLALLDKAKADLAELLAGADAVEVSLREADVSSATASLEAAQQRLENATIVAPWDGLISQLNVEEGDPVNAATPIIEVVDPTVVEVDGIVDEIDVLFVQLGARALVSMDAIPGQELDGQVSEVATQAVNQQGVVSYPLRIHVQTPPGVLLPEGLSAVAQVIIREERGVLLLPIQALRGSFDEPMVLVSQDGRIEERPVVLGDSDGFWVVIESGLAESEPVVMESQQASTQQGFAALRGLIGGGFGGGGFRGGPGGGRGRSGAGAGGGGR